MKELSSVTRPFGQKTSSELMELIVSMVASMQNDYGDQFKRNYPDNDSIEYEGRTMDSLRMLKNRFYKLLKPFPHECIVNGYENCIAKHPEFMPTIPSIISYISEDFLKYKQRLKNQDELKRIEAMPEPKKKTMTGPDILQMLREALQAPAGPESERLERLKSARESHEALIADHTKRGLIRTGMRTGTLCCKCDRPGVLSNGTTGNGNWYCSSHFLGA